MLKKQLLHYLFGVVFFTAICSNHSVTYAGNTSDFSYFPHKAASYCDNKIGFIHGAQYWVHSDANTVSIEKDFKAIAEEDNINAVRLPFWALFYPGKIIDWTLADICFDAAAKHNVKINPVLPQIPGWVDGSADEPSVRQKYKEHIQNIVAHFKDKPALAMWTVDIEPSRSYKAKPTAVTMALYQQWLPRRYGSIEEFRAKNPDIGSFEAAYAMNSREKGPWNNFQGFNDWITFTAWALAEQTRFTVEAVKEIDPVHPTSCTPPDVLHNQLIENGRNMWWLADVVDYPGCQMHAHWHLETADMPKDVLIAQSCSIRKVYNSARGRAASYTGEVLGGYDLGESTRFYSPTTDELLCTTLCHLAEGSKGYFYWLWNPLREGPNAGAWAMRELDGSPNEKSAALAQFGKMVKNFNDVLYSMKPADTPVAIYDSVDAAIYLARRSEYHPMSEWYVKNQYGFYKALRKIQVGCDFIDERGLNDGTIDNYNCIYVPFSMTMENNIAQALRDYVRSGGTIIVDCMTAFTPREHQPYSDQPGVGMQEVLGIKSLGFEMAYDGWTEIRSKNKEEYFDRMITGDQPQEFQPLYDNQGKKSPLIAKKFIQPVQPLTAKVLYRDKSGRPICTINQFGKGNAIWVGTLLGITCWDANTPYRRYEAIGELIHPFLTPQIWSLKAPDNSIICRRLTNGNDDLFILINEGTKIAGFTLDFGQPSILQELLNPEMPSWKKDYFSKSKINGKLKPLEGSVIYRSPMVLHVK